jgi:hypothetical protein
LIIVIATVDDHWSLRRDVIFGAVMCVIENSTAKLRRECSCNKTCGKIFHAASYPENQKKEHKRLNEEDEEKRSD